MKKHIALSLLIFCSSIIFSMDKNSIDIATRDRCIIDQAKTIAIKKDRINDLTHSVNYWQEALRDSYKLLEKQPSSKHEVINNMIIKYQKNLQRAEDSLKKAQEEIINGDCND